MWKINIGRNSDVIITRAEEIYKKNQDAATASRETTEMDKNNMTAGSKEQMNETQEQTATEEKK